MLPRAASGRLTWTTALAATLLAVFAAALYCFVRAEGVVDLALPRTQALEPKGVHNLVALQLGPSVRASSYWSRLQAQHHPAYLVDGVRAPTLAEKWASTPTDRAPWIELVFSHPAQLTRVDITHAGFVEEPKYTARNYSIRCLTAGHDGRKIAIRNNLASKRSHPLACDRALGIRLELDPTDLPEHVVRVYEVEAFGQ
jgi:hypothetical protein